jgi:hypothetical protein
MLSEAEVLEHLRRKYAPAAVILVGSRADGRARPGSDWDLYLLLRGDPARAGRVVPAPERLGDELLDVGLVRLPVPPDAVLGLFGPNLQEARILLDDEAGSARSLCAAARERYALGRGLGPDERERREQEFLRNLARMRARAAEPGPFFEALAYVFYAAHCAWYEVLHDRFSRSVHRAMPEIAALDPGFHRDLIALIGGASPGERIAAAERLHAALFRPGREDA